MKLTYHGATYTTTPQRIETIETTIECSFLGNTTKLKVAKHAPNHPPLHILKYRGISYQG